MDKNIILAKNEYSESLSSIFFSKINAKHKKTLLDIISFKDKENAKCPE